MGTRILIPNAVMLNGGDAAIVEAMMEAMRSRLGPETSFRVADAHPEAARTRFPELEIGQRPWDVFAIGPGGARRGRTGRRLAMVRGQAAAWLMRHGIRRAARAMLSSREAGALASYDWADVVVAKGGTYLVEHYELGAAVFDLRLARLLGKPLVLYTQSLGPFTPGRPAQRLKSLLDDATVLVRDERSRRHLLDTGVGAERIAVYPDAAFGLNPPASRPPARGPLRVAVSVREWRHFATVQPDAGMRAYEAMVRDLVERLVTRSGAHVTFLSTCQGTGAYVTDDSRTAARIAAALPSPVRSAVEVDTGFRRPGELLEAFAGYDLVIATRLHVAILALVAGVPVLPIAYEFKTRELWEKLGLGEVLDIEAPDVPAASRAVDQLVADLPGARRQVAAAVRRERSGAVQAASVVAALVAPAPRPIVSRALAQASPATRGNRIAR